MGEYKKILFLFILVWGSQLKAQSDNIIVDSNVDGVVSYITTSTEPGTLFFTLFGDGYYSHFENPIHKFEQNSNGYNTTAYFVKPYKPNNPPNKTVPTGGTGTGGFYTNPSVYFTGNTKVFTSWTPTFRKSNFFILAFKNDHSQQHVDGCVEFHFHKRRTRANANQILEYNNWVFNREVSDSNIPGLNKSFVWEYENLGPDEIRYVYIPAMNVVKPNEEFFISSVFRPGCSDLAIRSDEVFTSGLFPHDPNMKIADPACLPTGQSVHTMTYTISFFNDGETYAQDVFIKDLLSDKFDLSTFQLVDSEYPASATLNGNVLQIDIPGIKLPGTNQAIPNAFSLEECTSWVKFKINTIALSQGDCIENEAGIYFDNLSPVITPLSTVCYCPRDKSDGGNSFNKEIEISNIERSYAAEDIEMGTTSSGVSISPNPMSDEFVININQKDIVGSELEITLLNSSGKQVKKLIEKVNFDHNFQQRFSSEGLDSGVYFVKIQSTQSISVMKIIKM